MHDTISGVKAEQFGVPIPCVKWGVQEVTVHNIKVSQSIYSLLTDGESVNILRSVDQLLPEGASDEVEASTGQSLEVTGVRANLEKLVVWKVTIV